MERTSGQGQFTVPLVRLDRSRGAGVPLHRQIRAQIARAIRQGNLTDGLRLPSTRLLARLLRVSRNTVLAAYDELDADGLICRRQGTAARVATAARFPGIPPLRMMRQLLNAAGYPARVVAFRDRDGNQLYLRRLEQNHNSY